MPKAPNLPKGFGKFGPFGIFAGGCMRIGIDVGGTFTDIVLIDDKGKKIHYTKVFLRTSRFVSPQISCNRLLVGGLFP